ncbi:hypothetical protein [Brevundimonas sp.]|uniref:hypothetical protein n=1 Tax=Brevundimonas sp. TaxID=1871086 RepID=UPI0028AC832C|nr:hypothetical protein [Brevundimonas sp.]
MTDLRIIPDEPWAEARDTYRRFACEDRPGDPWAIPFDANAKPFRLLALVPRLLVCMAPVAALALLWSRLP